MEQSRFVYGMMRIADKTPEEVLGLLHFLLEHGVTKLDIADIYGDTKCETRLGQAFALEKGLREKFFIQSKVGIVRSSPANYFDFSKAHILEGVNASLKRLGIDHLDSLLLHRPDVLMDNEEVADAIAILKAEGKILHFGVSNMNREQIEYLEEALSMPIEIDQLQLGLGQNSLVSDNFYVDCPKGGNLTSGGLLFFLKRRKIQIEAWSPLLVGFFEGSIFTDPRYEDARKVMAELAKKYGTTPSAIASAFVTSTAPNVSIVVGSTNKDHLLEAIHGSRIQLDHKDYYALLNAAHVFLP